MLYILLGSDKKKIEKEIEKRANKNPVLKIDSFSWDPDLARSKIEGSSLFGFLEEAGEALLFDSISDNSEFFLDLKSFAENMRDSEKTILIQERELNKDDLLFFENLKIEIVDLVDKKEREYEYSPFALQDAVGSKSAKQAWIEFMKLRELGIEPEEIAPKIVNKMRDMLAIIKGANKESLGIKSDYPFNKSKNDAANWKEKELSRVYARLIALYHEARMGGEELSIALEKELLTL